MPVSDHPASEPGRAHPPRVVRRLGIFGGTFDPPHVGHLVTAVNVRHSLDLDLVLLVVAGSPWQKTGSRPITPAADRLAMARAAVDEVEGIEVSSTEVDRGGPSYTVDTLAEMRARYPDAECFVILGADAAALVPTWERFPEVLSMARLVVVDRPGSASDLPPITDWLRVEVPHLEVSSTDLRRRFADGRPLDFLVPAAVLRCARERGLYREPAAVLEASL